MGAWLVFLPYSRGIMGSVPGGSDEACTFVSPPAPHSILKWFMENNANLIGVVSHFCTTLSEIFVVLKTASSKPLVDTLVCIYTPCLSGFSCMFFFFFFLNLHPYWFNTIQLDIIKKEVIKMRDANEANYCNYAAPSLSQTNWCTPNYPHLCNKLACKGSIFSHAQVTRTHIYHTQI